MLPTVVFWVFFRNDTTIFLQGCGAEKTEYENMNWLQKICAYRGEASPRGLQFYMPETIGPFGSIYQSSDFPHVFLGSSDPDDIKEAETIAGQPICFRFDVAAVQNRHLPHADFETYLPEYSVWGKREQRRIQPKLKKTIDTLANIISTKSCPIYVHCSAGMNRSVAVLAGAISKLTNRSIESILKEIKSKRGSTSPHDSYLYMLSRQSPYDSPVWKKRIQEELAEADVA